MTNEAKQRPTHRVSYSRITGMDAKGNDILGPAREIGAVWGRTGDKKGGIIRLDVIPAQIENGVLFLLPVDDQPRA